LPEDPVAYARALFIEEYSDTKLFSALSAIYFERYIKPNVFKTECDEAVVAAKVKEELEPVLDQIEGMIPDASGPLVGDAFSLADIAFGAQLSSLMLAKIELDAERWPKVRAYSEWVLGRDSFASVLKTMP
jgi:glutathione S-transferase